MQSASRKPSNTILSPVPKPLRVFKKASRKFSLQQLRPNAAAVLTSITESGDAAASRNTSLSSIDSQNLAAFDPRVGGNSSVTFLPTPEPSEPEDEEAIGPGVVHRATSFAAFDGEKALYRKPSYIGKINAAKNHIKRKASLISAGGHRHDFKQCALCRTAIASTKKTYTFPRTAPAVIAAVRLLYPEIDIRSGGESQRPLNSLMPKPLKPSSTWSNNGSRSNSLTSALSLQKQSINILQSNGFNEQSSLAATTATEPPSPTSTLEFCITCFTYLHGLRICWTCGERVDRTEERVGCGWAWWHWGCLGCLLCRVRSLSNLFFNACSDAPQAPIPPPAWTAHPITLSEPPACKACLRELRELVALERREHMTRPRRRISSGRDASQSRSPARNGDVEAVVQDGTRMSVDGRGLGASPLNSVTQPEVHKTKNGSTGAGARSRSTCKGSGSLTSTGKPVPTPIVTRRTHRRQPEGEKISGTKSMSMGMGMDGAYSSFSSSDIDLTSTTTSTSNADPDSDSDSGPESNPNHKQLATAAPASLRVDLSSDRRTSKKLRCDDVADDHDDYRRTKRMKVRVKDDLDSEEVPRPTMPMPMPKWMDRLPGRMARRIEKTRAGVP